METKKNPVKDIHRMRGVFFLVGVITSLGITIGAFQFESKKIVHKEREPVDWNIMTTATIIPITAIEPPKPEFVVEKKVVASQPSFEPTTIVVSSIEQSEGKTPDMEAIGSLTLTPTFTIDEEPTEEVFLFVESQPTPIGGYEKFYRDVAKDLDYPNVARRQNIEGKVFVEFIVERDGTVSDVRVIKGIGFGCDEAAMKAVEHRLWTPGKQRGKPVRVRMVAPITFKLN
jgi:periplasmic protein TonB